MDLVAVPATDSFVAHVALALEFGDDALRGTLGDPDPLCDLAQQHVRILGDAEQHVAVVREERPTVRSWHGANHTSLVS